MNAHFFFRPRGAAAFLAAGFLLLACSLPLSLPGLGGEDASDSGGGENNENVIPNSLIVCPSEDTLADLT